MTIKPIRNDDNLKRVFRRLEKIFQAGEGTAQADERDVLVMLRRLPAFCSVGL